jgi:hypothetical protein
MQCVCSDRLKEIQPLASLDAMFRSGPMPMRISPFPSGTLPLPPCCPPKKGMGCRAQAVELRRNVPQCRGAPSVEGEDRIKREGSADEGHLRRESFVARSSRVIALSIESHDLAHCGAKSLGPAWKSTVEWRIVWELPCEGQRDSKIRAAASPRGLQRERAHRSKRLSGQLTVAQRAS